MNPLTSSLFFEWAARSKSGKKKPENDDAYAVSYCSLEEVKTLQDQGKCSLEAGDILVTLADGVGGNNAGNVASSMIVEQMKQVIPKVFKQAANHIFPSRLEYLEQAITEVNESLISASKLDSALSEMSSTLALLWMTPENAYLANVGDSRIYWHHEGQTIQISKDHCHAWNTWKQGNMTEYEYRNHPRKNILYQALGSSELIYPHMAVIPLHAGDRFLICSDGIMDGLWERHIHDFMSIENLSAEDLLNEIINTAFDNAGWDDTSLVIINILK